MDGDLHSGERIGDRWIVREQLGCGGHATVYRAEHAELGHSAAIKVLHLDRCGAAAEEMLGRFRREARIAARLQHRNVVRVFDWGELANGWPYFVMQLVPGEDLQALIDRVGALPIAAGVDVALQSLAGLGALGELGVVHRDVKPGNVMIEQRPSGARIARLVDLGIASKCAGLPGPRFTIEGTVLGTPEYMSPEQIRGLELDPRADLYSLGVVLYESLTGFLPFHGKGPCATLALALTQDPAPVRSMRPDCPEAIDAIVMRALAKDPEARFDSARAMALALAAAADACGLPRGAAAWRGVEERSGARRLPAPESARLDVRGDLEVRDHDDSLAGALAGAAANANPEGAIHARPRRAAPDAPSAHESAGGSPNAPRAMPPTRAMPPRRPAARARRQAPPPLPRAAAPATPRDEPPTSTTVRLKARNQASGTSPAGRFVLALLAVGLATAIGIGAATGIPVAEVQSSRALPSAAPIPADATEAVRAGIAPATTLLDP